MFLTLVKRIVELKCPFTHPTPLFRDFFASDDIPGTQSIFPCGKLLTSSATEICFSKPVQSNYSGNDKHINKFANLINTH